MLLLRQPIEEKVNGFRKCLQPSVFQSPPKEMNGQQPNSGKLRRCCCLADGAPCWRLPAPACYDLNTNGSGCWLTNCAMVQPPPKWKSVPRGNDLTTKCKVVTQGQTLGLMDFGWLLLADNYTCEILYLVM